MGMDHQCNVIPKQGAAMFHTTPRFTPNGNRLITLTLDPFCFMFNSIALGDVIAAVPTVKYMVENYYTRSDSYLVVAKRHFWPLFPFVPEENLRDYDQKDNNWGIPDNFVIGAINRKTERRLTRLTPKHMHLAEFGSLMLADRLIPREHLNYVPLKPVDVSRFGVDFRNSVILITSYRDVTRRWEPEQILNVAEWLKVHGITPVFVGKTDMDQTAREQVRPKTSLPEDVSEYGVDLRNQTSLPELATIMGMAKAVCGIDSGPIHLAGTTSVPIVCGYTSVAPEHRIPIRQVGVTHAIHPELDCIGCESRWRSNTWNYENCYLGHANCCSAMTSNRFTNILKSILRS